MISGAQGIAVTIDQGSGRYEIRSQELNWTFAGTLDGPAGDIRVVNAEDRLGPYEELHFRWRGRTALSGTLRTYAKYPVVLFGITSEGPVADGSVIRFPRFTELPRNLHGFSYRDTEFSPPSFALEENGTPWLLFDERAHAALLSPASNFMSARMLGPGKSEIVSGLNAAVAKVPAGFTHRTLMVFGSGINQAWNTWGAALTALQGIHRPANDADAGLRYLGYWTDHGAAYYYDYDRRLGYAGTLEAVLERYRTTGIPIRYLQLDSWWYSKTLTDPSGKTGQAKNPDLPPQDWNRYGGLLRYEAHPALFPDGLAVFQKRAGLPLIVHNRWIDSESPYHRKYRISGFAVVDPDWWKMIMAYVSAANVVTYEQDWLNVIYEHSPALAASVTAGDAFTDAMAAAAREKGLTLQYSMPLPRHFLQGARYGNLTSIRVSGDRFGRDRWDWFLYTSRLASAVGIWPWTDVFMSSETDNLLIATLSAGMVGTGDRIGAEHRENLLRAVRLDGVIVKPDTALVPIDRMYVLDAHRPDRPMIACAHTDHGALRTSYVLSYRRTWRHTKASFTPAEVGVPGDVYVYDVRTRIARRLAGSETFTFHLLNRGAAYFVVAPVSHTGISLFGDADKFVPGGHQRIESLIDQPERLTATVKFAPGEKFVRLFGYAARRPSATAQTGSAGEVSFDAATGRFEFLAYPSQDLMNERPGTDPVRRATVSMQCASGCTTR